MARRTIINPILKKDILVNARSARMVVTITVINCLFALVVGMLFMTSRGSAYQVYYSNIAQMFPVLAVCELCIIGLIVPIITSTSISGERERQTLEIMRTTPVRPISIVAGKLLSAVATTAMYVIATLPFMAVAFIVGGMGWDELFKYLGMVLFIDIYVGSIGIFYSCVKRTSVSAAISTIVTIAVVVFLSYAIGKVFESMMYMSDGSRSSYAAYMMGKAVCYAVNPAMWIAENFIRLLGDESVVETMTGYGKYTNFVVDHMAVISVCVNLAASFVLLKVASVKLVKGSRKRKKSRI